MFERFTPDARRVVVLAQEEARLYHSGSITPAHLVLGLLHSDGERWSATEVVLRNMDIDIAQVRGAMERLVTAEGIGSMPSGHIPFTPEAKKALENTLRQGLQLGYSDLDAPVMLLGVLAGENDAATALEQLGVTLGRMKGPIADALMQSNGEPRPGPGLEETLRRIAQEMEDAIIEPGPEDRMAEVRAEPRPVSFHVEIDVTDRKVVIHTGVTDAIYTDLAAAKLLQNDLDRAIKMCEGEAGLLFQRFTVTWAPENVARALAEMDRYWNAVNADPAACRECEFPSLDSVSIAISAIKQVLSS